MVYNRRFRKLIKLKVKIILDRNKKRLHLILFQKLLIKIKIYSRQRDLNMK